MRIYNNLTELQLSRIEHLQTAKQRRWSRNWKYFSDVLYNLEELKAFFYFVTDECSSVDSVQSESEFSSEEEDKIDQFLHSKNYWYDSNEDKYVIQLKSKNRPMILTGSYWRSIKSAYSNWTGKGSSVNEICRKYELTRATLTELLKVMGVTHDSSPFTEENVLQSTESELVEQLIRQKEESILLETKRREYRMMKKYYDTYRSHRKYAEEIGILIAEKSGTGLDSRQVFEYDLDLEEEPKILLVSPTDFHWGKYAGKHTGDAYNRVIAENRLFECTDRLLLRVMNRKTKPEKIVVGLGGDGLHIDNMQKFTTRGTPQDVDGSPIEIVHSYVDLCRRYVLYLRKFCEVDVYVVNGNHDFYSSVFLRACLYACFQDYKGVNVVADLGVRQTFLYGNSLITFIHGDDGSVKDYPSIIASESSKLWGKSKYRYIFTGHFHTERELPQFGDAIVHRMPSLAGTDDWHHKKGYKSRKSLIGYIIDKDEGLISKEIVSVRS